MYAGLGRADQISNKTISVVAVEITAASRSGEPLCATYSSATFERLIAIVELDPVVTLSAKPVPARERNIRWYVQWFILQRLRKQKKNLIENEAIA